MARGRNLSKSRGKWADYDRNGENQPFESMAHYMKRSIEKYISIDENLGGYYVLR
jgi:hypothetical protein